jgi:hypothetical protein
MTNATNPTLAGETLLTLHEVAKRYPGRTSAKRLHFSSLIRRILTGTRNSFTGEVVKLEAFRDGGRWLTSEQAVARYHERLNRRAAEPEPAKPTERKRRRSRVDAELDAAGL